MDRVKAAQKGKGKAVEEEDKGETGMETRASKKTGKGTKAKKAK